MSPGAFKARVAVGLAAVALLAAGCGDDGLIRAGDATTTTAVPELTGTIWAKPSGFDPSDPPDPSELTGLTELDLDGTAHGVPPGLEDRTTSEIESVSPDRRRVVFADYDGWSADVREYDRDTHELRDLGAVDGCFTLDEAGDVVAEELDPDNPLAQRCPVRLGDGSILWIERPDGLVAGVIRFTRTTPTGDEEEVGEIEGCSVGSWAASPTNDELAFSTNCLDGGAGIDVVDLSTMDRRRVANGEHSTVPSWSPDGSRVLFARSTDGSPENFRLFVVNADGSGERQISDRPYLWPVWID